MALASASTFSVATPKPLKYGRTSSTADPHASVWITGMPDAHASTIASGQGSKRLATTNTPCDAITSVISPGCTKPTFVTPASALTASFIGPVPQHVSPHASLTDVRYARYAA